MRQAPAPGAARITGVAGLKMQEQPSQGQPPQNDTALPLLDPAVLEKLHEELEDGLGLWKVFVSNFIALLPTRIERLRVSLTTGDLTGSLDAVLSLKTSSQMVGAERLAGLALDLEQAIRTNPGADLNHLLPWLASTHLKAIQRCSRQTTDQLEKYASDE
ncbi:Hpt domain-containing protein [Pseudarthrobacter phenanthrenivorans]|uniref:Hpt domain-containing protein n=1 Tax=Pseudarthrobacter phenanthrenivorans TaxID=361575 RepID=UPI00344E8A1D